MSRKKPEERGEPIDLKLTPLQRQSLVECTRLRRGLKDRIAGAPKGAGIAFTRKEILEFQSEVDASIVHAPGPKRRSKESGLVYQLKVTLKGIKPPIWRRIQVPDLVLGDLHYVIQVVMGWDNSHLHQFVIDGVSYGEIRPDDVFAMDEVEDEDRFMLGRFVPEGGNKKILFMYEYDFGDNWRHEVLVERSLEPEAGVEYPRCLAGARACPPEDVGGIWGYAEFLEAIDDPAHGRHKELSEWFAGAFDPEAFSVEAVDRILRRSS